MGCALTHRCWKKTGKAICQTLPVYIHHERYRVCIKMMPCGLFAAPTLTFSHYARAVPVPHGGGDRLVALRTSVPASVPGTLYFRCLCRNQKQKNSGTAPSPCGGNVGAADNPRSDTIRYLNEYLPFTYTMSAQVYV